MRGPRRWLLSLPCALVLSACGDVPAADLPQPAAARSQAPSSASSGVEHPELYGKGLVLQEGHGGVVLCLGPVADAAPLQCEGPRVTNWDWASVPGEVTRAGVTTGTYVVVGTYDGETFTLTRPATTPEAYDGPRAAIPDAPPMTSPCPEPADGWRVVDPDATTPATLKRTLRVATDLQGFSSAWLDQSVDPAQDERHVNDPRRLVLDVAVTGDRGTAEEKLRQTWGGALCVSKALHSQEDLRSVLAEVTGGRGVQSAAVGRDQVDLQVLYDDGTLQRSLDEKYGVGMVVVTSGLQPYPTK